MNWHDELLAQLSAEPICGYRVHGPRATEPTALAAMALAASDRLVDASRAAEWLAGQQAESGSLGVREQEPVPQWPTGLAVLAWSAVASRTNAPEGRGRYRENSSRAVDWLLSCEGRPMPRDAVMGHDTTIVAWPWVEGTHSWIEPTAINLLALKATGQGAHRRARDAVRMLIDRQLSTGGCNYGNTSVLGQELRPHVQPTGLALLALAGETDPSGRLEKSLAYLEQSVATSTSPASLGYALLGLAAHQRFPEHADPILQRAYEYVQHHDQSPYKLAVLALARLGPSTPFQSLIQPAAV